MFQITCNNCKNCEYKGNLKSISNINKEASRLYAELCEPMLKFFIFVSRNEPDR